MAVVSTISVFVEDFGEQVFVLHLEGYPWNARVLFTNSIKLTRAALDVKYASSTSGTKWPSCLARLNTTEITAFARLSPVIL